MCSVVDHDIVVQPPTAKHIESRSRTSVVKLEALAAPKLSAPEAYTNHVRGLTYLHLIHLGTQGARDERGGRQYRCEMRPSSKNQTLDATQVPR